MRVYGKEQVGNELWNSIVEARVDYYTDHYCYPTHLELNSGEFSILKYYLRGLVLPHCTHGLPEISELLNMKLVIKD